MESAGIWLIAALLCGAALYCVWLLIRFSKKLGSLRGEPMTEELEDMDKLRAELLETNKKLREELARLKKALAERDKR
ncbi:MAG: hypothetical protein HY586_07785 [Candidatus Omnitrophica bacterium]|nr:hypothetical protein [Candidatus Omnitrophota bacterium]